MTFFLAIFLALSPAHAGADDVSRPVVVDPLRTEDPAPRGLRKRRIRELTLSLRDGGHPPQVRYLKLVELADLTVDQAKSAGDAEQAKLEAHAAKLYGEALKNAPDHPAVARVMMVTAVLLLRGDEPKKSAKLLEALVAAYPQSPYEDWAWALLGDLRFADRDMAGAAEAYDKVGTGHELAAWARFRHGWARYNVGDLEGARDSLIAARALARDDEGDLADAIENQATKDALSVASTFAIEDALMSVEVMCKGEAPLCKTRLGRMLADAYDDYGQTAEAQKVRSEL